jgi:hypothetical protein
MLPSAASAQFEHLSLCHLYATFKPPLGARARLARSGTATFISSLTATSNLYAVFIRLGVYFQKRLVCAGKEVFMEDFGKPSETHVTRVGTFDKDDDTDLMFVSPSLGIAATCAGGCLFAALVCAILCIV